GMGKKLHPVTDAEGRQTGSQNVVGQRGRAGFVDGARPAGKNEAARVEGQDLLGGRIKRKELAVDLRLAHAAGDELRKLRTEVENSDCVHKVPKVTKTETTDYTDYTDWGTSLKICEISDSTERRSFNRRREVRAQRALS